MFIPGKVRRPAYLLWNETEKSCLFLVLSRVHHQVMVRDPVPGKWPMGFLKKQDVYRLTIQPHHQKIPVLRWKAAAIPWEAGQAPSLHILGRRHIFGRWCVRWLTDGNSQLWCREQLPSVPCVTMQWCPFPSSDVASLANCPDFASLVWFENLPGPQSMLFRSVPGVQLSEVLYCSHVIHGNDVTLTPHCANLWLIGDVESKADHQ